MRRRISIGVALLALAVGGGAGYWFAIRDEPATSGSSLATSLKEETGAFAVGCSGPLGPYKQEFSGSSPRR